MGRRNNSTRTGAPRPNAPAPPIAKKTDNGLFSFVTPTEFVELPSGGKYYPEDHPLAGVDTIEIRHMTAKEEDILTSETLVRKGLAIDRLLQSVIVDPNIIVDSLLIGDKNALLVACRVTGFGPLYETTVKCPACNETNEQEFNLDDISHVTSGEVPADVVITETGNFIITLPTTQVEAEVRLLCSRDERILSETTEKKKKMKLPDTRSTDLLKAVIVSLNEHTDRSDIDKFVSLMPLRDVKHLRNAYEKIKPDLDISYDFECQHCAHVGKVVMPLTAQFFWPNS